MKKKRTLFGLFLILALLLTGCSTEQKTEEKGYKLYYVSVTDPRLVEVSYSPKATTFEEMMSELMGALSSSTGTYTSPMTGGVTYLGYERGIDALRVNFSSQYYGLSNIEEVLLRSSVVKTISQIPGVTKVMLTVDGEQIRDAQGEPIPPMDANSFIDTQEGGINSYLYATLNLFFADKEGKTLENEKRTYHYSSNMVLERVVVEQLIEGPQSRHQSALFTKNVKILSFYIQNGICTINFDEEINKTPTEQEMDPYLAIYGIVNSICQTCDEITGVKIEIEGESDVLFRGVVDLNQIFMMNQTLNSDDDISQQTIAGNEIVGIDPSLAEE